MNAFENFKKNRYLTEFTQLYIRQPATPVYGFSRTDGSGTEKKRYLS